MSISYISSGTAVYSTGNPSPTTPTHNVGDLLVLVVGTKPDTTPATTPSGWTLVGAASGGAGTTGIDTGPMRVGVFIRVADGSGSDTTGAITITGNNVSAAEVHVFRNSTGVWDVAGVGGADTSTGATFSVAMASNPGITAGNMLFAVGIIPTDITTPSQFSSEQVSATGLTTVSLTEIDEFDTSSGSDMGGWQAYGAVVTGTATGNPTVTSTAGGTTTNVAGPIFLLRMTEAATKSGTDTASVAISDSSSVVPTDVSNATFNGLYNSGTDTFATAQTVTRPGSGTTDQDIVVVQMTQWNSTNSFPTIGGSHGMTQVSSTVQASATGFIKTIIYAKYVTTETSWAFTWTGQTWTTTKAMFIGNVDQGLTLSSLPKSTSQASSGTSPSAVTINTGLSAGDMLVWFINTADYSAGGPHDAPVGFTEPSSFDDNPSMGAYMNASDGDETAGGGAVSESNGYIVTMVAIKAAAITATPITGTDTASVAISDASAITVSTTGTDTASVTITEGTTKLRRNVTYVDQYVLQAGTTSIGLTPPAGTAAGDADIIWVANKNSTATPSAPSGGWTQLFSDVVGTGSNGAGTGPIRITAWWRELTGASTSTTVTISGANVSMGGGMVYRKDSALSWNITAATGSDTSSGTGFSAVVASNLLMDIGDYLMSVGFFTLNTTLPGRGITIPGITNTVTGINSGGSATGNQLFGWTDHAFVTALGAQSSASSTDGTAGAATTGGAMNIRVSADFVTSTTPITGTDTASVAISDASAITAGITGTDTSSVTITEGTTALGSSSSRTDTASVSIADASTNAVSSERTDTASVSIADSSAIQAGITGTDTASVSVADTSNVVVSINVSDTSSVDIADASTNALSTSVTDTSSVAAADASTNNLSSSVTDTASVAIADASTNAVSSSVTDTSSVAISESSSVVIVSTVNGTDTSSVSIVDASTIQAGITGTDTASVAIADASTNNLSSDRADTASVAIADSSSVLVSISVSDTSSVSIAETVATLATIAGTDTSSITITESRVVAVIIFGTDTSSITISDASNVNAPSAVAKAYQSGNWVQGNLKVWKDNQWKSAFIKRRSGGSWI